MGSIRDAIDGSHVLVTGVTGFLGKVWLTMVLDHLPEVGRVTVVIRGRRGESAEARFRKLAETSPAFRPLRAKYGEDFEALLEEKVEVVEGDLGKPGCGLDAETTERLAGSLDAVVHFAGLTDFEPDPAAALKTNVLGAVYAADLAAKLRRPRLVHVSTAFVAGNVSGDIPESIEPGVSPLGERFDPERVLEELSEACGRLHTRRERVDWANERAAEIGWPNIYTFTKGLSEHLLAARDDVELSIIRPSVVESSLDYPFPGWNEGINTSGPLVWLLSSWFRKLPSKPKHRFDVVPVDTVARSTVAILAAALDGPGLGGSRGSVYHLASSDTNPLTFERAIDLTALASRRMHSKKEASGLERMVLKYMDAVPRDADRDPFPSLPFLRRTAQKMRNRLRDLDLGEVLPPRVWEERGEEWQRKIRSLGQDCRNADRTLGRIEDMLRLYKPFIHDNDYVFLTGRVRALTERLDEAERALFGFDVHRVEWRSYWLDIHVPGLEKWSLPLLKGERVEQDAPPKRLPRPRSEAAPKAVAREQEYAIGGAAE